MQGREYASTEALAAHPKIARFVEWIARTLFHAAGSQRGDDASDALARRCDAILRITALQGYPACSLTAKQLSSSGR